ncbi:hypothetical protein CF326_g8538 [Tilletia indica]|nr:hypothetical protein CF326_g8538 [Tilletia indica]
MYENDIQISGPAKCSKLGLEMDLSAGYHGFTYVRSWRSDNGTIKEKWECKSCGNPYTASKAGHNSNLISHRGKCKGPSAGKRGQKKNVIDLTGNDNARVGKSSTAVSTITAASSATLAGSYRGPSLSGWIGGQQVTHPLLTRRRGLIAVIQNALPFQHLRSPAIVKLVKSMDARAVMSLRSDTTVRRDLTKFHASLKSELHQELQGIDTLLSIQHDAWTTKAYQHSFVAMIASYVNSAWEYREALLSFDVIKAKHTGATFSGHLVRTLADYDLDDKWYGPVVSDSTGVNHRMLDVLQYDLSQKGLQQRSRSDSAGELENDSHSSPSAFPSSSARKKGVWLAEQNKILCLNHHVNIAVRAGFSRFGIQFKAKAKNKFLNILPKPPITVTDENGETVELDEDEGSEGDDEEAELEEDLIDGRASENEEGDDESMDDDDSDSDSDLVDEDEEGLKLDQEEEGWEDEDEEFRPDMEPSPSELGSEDEGGPANDTPQGPSTAPSRPAASSKQAQGGEATPTSAIAKLEAFTVDIHRSPQRRAQFRSRMEKEYHKKPKKASAPFPPKPNGTRWNSHWAMIKAALKIRDAIDAHCRAFIGSRATKFGSYLLSDSQWRQLELLKPILALASAVTKSMERAEGTLCMVLDHHASLRDEVDILLSKVELEEEELEEIIVEELKVFCDAMAKKLTKYRDLALSSRLTLAAALLHPQNRMKLFEAVYPDYQRAAEKALRSLLTELIGDPDLSSASSSKKTPAKATVAVSPLSAARARRDLKLDNNPEKTARTRKPDEVALYLDIEFCPWRDSDESPYKWWKDNEKVFPNVSKLARLVLGIPGSSSSVERVFSQAALFSTHRRARLSAKSISQLVTTKHWLREGGDELAGLGSDVRRCAKMIDELPDYLITKRPRREKIFKQQAAKLRRQQRNCTYFRKIS